MRSVSDDAARRSPDNVDLEHVTSGLLEGVLTIVAPLSAASKARKLQIGGGQSKS